MATRRKKLDLTGVPDEALVAFPAKLKRWLLEQVHRDLIRLKVRRNDWLAAACLLKLAQRDQDTGPEPM